jgi:c-di-GMP-binding flagellar brake protein YcgR
VLASDAVHFAAQFESARLEFTVAGNKLRIQGDEGLLRVELPTQLLRFDRRAHYRGKLRPDAGASCEVGADHRSVRVFAVHDISVGGIGLSFAGAPENLLVGGVLRDCLVKLPGIESFSVDLEIRCLSEDAQREDGRFLRLGCKFLNLAPSAAEAVSRFASCCD